MKIVTFCPIFYNTWGCDFLSCDFVCDFLSVTFCPVTFCPTFYLFTLNLTKSRGESMG